MKLRKAMAITLSAVMIGTTAVPARAEEEVVPEFPVIFEQDFEYYGDVMISSDIAFNGWVVVVNGSLTQCSDINLNGAHLIVTGDYIQSSGVLCTGGGTLTVAGNYYQQSGSIMADSAEDITGRTGKIEVQSGFVQSAGAIHADAGTIEIGEGFVQNGGTVYADNGTIDIGADFVQKGDVYGNTGNIHVGDDYNQPKGTLEIGNSTFTVDGDYTLADVKTNEDGSVTYNIAYGSLKMQDDGGHFTVGGDFYTRSDNSDSSNVLTAGVLELQGNFTQMKGYWSNNFNAKENHKVVFSGTGKQTIYFEKPTDSGFNILEATPNEKAEITSGRINSIGEDVTVNSFVQYGTLNLGENSLTVTSDMTEFGNIDAGTGNFTVGGNYLHSGGTLSIKGSETVIKGNYRLQKEVTSEDGTISYGIASAGLNMNEEAGHFTVEGDFYTQSDWSDSSNVLTAGTLELKGDFTQLKGYWSNNFNARENHKVIFSGSEVQTIYFENPTSSGFNILYETSNPQTDITSGRIRLIGEDVTVRNFVQYGTLDLENHHLTVLEDMTEFGDVDVNTGKLTVEGNYLHSGGTLKINSGEADIKGDYRLQKGVTSEDGTTSYTIASAGLNMSEEAGHFTVEGDFYTQSDWSDSYNVLTDGTLELKGNFTQLKGYWSNNFNARENHKVMFTGTAIQTISFENAGTSGFNILSYSQNRIANLVSGRINKLENDAVVGSFSQYGTLDLNGHRLVVNGDMAQYGNINLNGGELVVNGNYLHSGGTLNVQDGTITVTGDYRLQSCTWDAEGNPIYGIANAGLKMEHADGYFTVQGDFYTQSDWNEGSNILTDGTLELKGNFTQLKGYWSNNFNAKGNHKVILSGTGKQTIYFENPTDSGFNILEATPNLKAEITSGRINSIGKNVTVNSFVQYGTLNLGANSLTVTSDLTQFGNVDAGTGTLTVGGNYLHSGGTLYIKGSETVVKGDYRLQKEVIVTNTNEEADGDVDGEVEADAEVIISYETANAGLSMNDAAGHFTVEGDFYAQSNWNEGSNELTAGTLELKGNFTQLKGYWKNNFNAKDNHKVILSGTGKQTIYFENPTDSGFNILEATPNLKAEITSGRINSIGKNVTVNSFVQYGTLNLGANSLTVTSDLTQFGNVDAGTGTLTVGGNYLHSGGTLYIKGSETVVKGDYRLQKEVIVTNTNEEADGDVDGEVEADAEVIISYETANAGLSMNDAAGHFTVEGDFYAQSNWNEGSNELTAGTLELKGNFTQLKGYWSNNFKARDEHITMLTGNETQTISFETPTSSYFNILKIRKDQFKNGDFVFANTPIPANSVVFLYDNLSFLNTETAVTGQVVTVAGYAESGTPPYTYTFFVRLAGDTNWYPLKSDFDDVVYAAFVPSAVGTYEVCAIAKDDEGSLMEKILTLKVQNGDGKKAGWEKDGTHWKYYNEFSTYCVNEWKVIKGKTYRFDDNGYMQTGWYAEDGNYYYLKENGSMARDEWNEIGGKRYHFDENGHMQTGWYEEDGTYYYLKADGSMARDEWVENEKYYVDEDGKWIKDKTKEQTGTWKENSKGKWYQYSDGTYPKNEWKEIDGERYHFDANGYVQTGWYVEDGTYYYLKEDGSMARDEWVENDKYYVDEDGKWIKGKTKEETEKTGTWKENSKGKWYQNADGTYPKNEWKKIDGKWYHFDANGYMQTGWYVENGTYYYLKADGSMAVDEWVENGKYYIDANGKWVKGKTQETGSWKKDSKGWWYQNADGTYPKNQWKKIGEKWYHFDAGGYMQTGWYKEGSVYYYLKADGSMAVDEWVENGKYYLDSNGHWVKDAVASET